MVKYSDLKKEQHDNIGEFYGHDVRRMPPHEQSKNKFLRKVYFSNLPTSFSPEVFQDYLLNVFICGNGLVESGNPVPLLLTRLVSLSLSLLEIGSLLNSDPSKKQLRHSI